ncbi:Hypothetical protein Minf_0113 [Methylacidiphilum infernorum V4]|uniref:Uncharacterized protein n=1 Tax=Methylacidiphilum infernorum (isolate V4) TaxID=481448 RepID=B3DX33_METI4|nr:Hypothetical protein Minf_0113 [Methylacidiphilum infernorum V4]
MIFILQLRILKPVSKIEIDSLLPILPLFLLPLI